MSIWTLREVISGEIRSISKKRVKGLLPDGTVSVAALSFFIHFFAENKKEKNYFMV